MKRIGVVIGTRPEAIKLAPVIFKLREAEKRGEARLRVYCTGQHREMLEPMFNFFGFYPDVNLNLMRPRQTLNSVLSDSIAGLDRVFAEDCNDYVVVQGDTTTAAAAALCAFHLGQAVAHVEAGLRTGNIDSPFPEEANRKIVSVVSRWNFAPTSLAHDALRREAVNPASIVVTGNTVIDALLWARARLAAGAVSAPTVRDRISSESRVVLVTAHRRENLGAGLRGICQAVRQLAEIHPDTQFVYPVHLNPRVRETVETELDGQRNVLLLAPLDYPSFVWLLNRCHLVLTDSGGVQEEAPTFCKPVLIIRDTTERREGVDAGCARLIGTTPQAIMESVSELLCVPAAYRKMAQALNPYGDGRAAERIVATLLSAPVVLS